MSTGTVEIFVATYATEEGATAALKHFQAARRAGAIDLIKAAVIVVLPALVSVPVIKSDLLIIAECIQWM